MSTKTPNFNLLKPELTDAADITKYNTNWDIIDNNLGKVNRTVPIEKGGTGGITAEQARDNLGVTEAINKLKENVESNYIPTSEKGAASGVATLGEDSKVPANQLPDMDYVKSSEKGAANGVATLGTDRKLLNTQLPNIPKGVEVFTRHGDGNTSFTLSFSSKPKLIYYMSMDVSGYDSVKVVGFNGYNYSIIDYYDAINKQYTRHSYSNLFTFGSTTTVKTVENDGTFITDSKFTAEIANKSNKTYLVIGVL